MLHLSLSIGPQKKVVAVGKGPQVVSVKKYDCELEDEDPLPIGALARLFTESNLNGSEVKRIRILDPFADQESEKSGWLKNLRRDWNLRSSVRSFFRNQLSPNLEVEFVHPERARLSFLVKKLTKDPALVWNFSSSADIFSENLWLWQQGQFYRQGTTGTGAHSIEAFFRAVADFSGFEGSEGLEKFFEIAHMGEPSFLSDLSEDLVSIDELGQFEFSFEKSEDLDTDHEDRVAALEDWFGVSKRRQDAPISTRELDLASSCVELLQRWVLAKMRPWLVQKKLVMPEVLMTGQSAFVELIFQQIVQLKVPFEVKKLELSETEMEALGALCLDENDTLIEPLVKIPYSPESTVL